MLNMNTISPRLDLRQSQNLVMTPQLQQAIKLLQLSNLELAEFIEAEIAQNPLLEKKEPEGTDAPDLPDTSTDGRDSDAGDEFDSAWEGDDAPPKAENPATDFDAGTAAIGAGGNRSFDTLDEAFENSLTRPETLREHLVEQIHMAFDDPRDRLIGAMIVDLVDEAGYLRASTDELMEKLGCKGPRVERLLSVMKKFTPSGIFARGFKRMPRASAGRSGKTRRADEYPAW
jgi:RNA polymerase sigma-54 factor